jgi:Spy/CpxP family protein refolding chaperone
MLPNINLLGSFSIRIVAPALAVMLAGATPMATAGASEQPRSLMHIAMMDEMMMGKSKAMGGNQAGGSMSGMGASSGSNSMEMACCMGAMGKSPAAGSGMQMQSALPGFPGASHLYHVGATGFFLDYADKLTMSTEQKATLNDLKQRALIAQSASDRKIEEAEQALWVLTAAEQPDATAVEAKTREIEKLKTDQRMAIIRAVGEAAKVLMPEQRKMVLGMVSMPAADATKPMDVMKSRPSGDSMKPMHK